MLLKSSGYTVYSIRELLVKFNIFFLNANKIGKIYKTRQTLSFNSLYFVFNKKKIDITSSYIQEDLLYNPWLTENSFNLIFIYIFVCV